MIYTKNNINRIDGIYEYALSISLRENKHLKNLRSATLKHPRAAAMIPADQGQFIAFILKIINATKTLDIGTYTGYSALCAALAMPENSITYTCDIEAGFVDIGKKVWLKAGVKNKIVPIVETGESFLLNLIENKFEEKFDFCFIDADKINYDIYYEYSLRLIRKGGVIMIDNMFLNGSVLSEEYRLSSKRKISVSDVDSIKKLNKKIYTDQRVYISLLNIFDGVTLITKK